MSLDKVVKVKDELRDLNSQLKYCFKDLKVSTSALKKALSPVATGRGLLKIKHRILSCDWLNYQLHSHPHRVSTVKVRI